MPRQLLLQACVSSGKYHLSARRILQLGKATGQVLRALLVPTLRGELFLQVAGQSVGQSVEATSGTVLNRIHSLLFRPKPYALPEPAQERIPKILHHILPFR